MKKRADHFLSAVTHHIKSKEARQHVVSELNRHIVKTKKSWIEKGLNEADAEEKAVEQMGSPYKLGQELNKLYHPIIDWWMLLTLLFVMGIGFLPLISLSRANLMDLPHFLLSKVVFVVLGILLAIGLMIIDYRKFEKKGWVFYLLGIMILFLVSYFPNVTINGEPFIEIGPVRIQAMLAIPFFFLAWASFFNNEKIKVWQHAAMFLLSLYLFLLIPNLPTTFIYIVMVFGMVWWSKVGKKKIIWMTVISSSIVIGYGIVAWFTAKEYQLARILAYLNPEEYSEGGGYTYVRLKELISQAGWFGTSDVKAFLPAAHTDLIFASLIHYYGYILAIVLVLLLSLLVVRMILLTYSMNHSYSKLLLIGGVTLFIVQFIYNIGMIVGLLPITSISLPLISYGLMPTLFNAFIIGIVLSIYRRKNFTISCFV